MRALWRWIVIGAILLAGWAAPAPRAQAADLDSIADHVVGQPDFAHGAANQGNSTPSAGSLSFPTGAVLDAAGRLYVADYSNHRVLEYDHPLTDPTADRVFGQPNFTDKLANQGNISASASSLYDPIDVAVDTAGHLYVADSSNNRVLEYDHPLSDPTADRVFGQPDFTNNQANRGKSSPSASSLAGPSGVAVDATGHLYVADTDNNRMLEYDNPLSDQTADRVFGQPDFTHQVYNQGSSNPSATTLSGPSSVAVDAAGRLYVADTDNNRVLEYDHPLSDQTADRVFGQPDFTHKALEQDPSMPYPTSLFLPTSVAVDGAGYLYVADSYNNRVVEYDSPLSDQTADHVFGQLDLYHNSPNAGFHSPNPIGLVHPAGVALDAERNLWVADSYNNRVLEFDVPLPNPTPTLTALTPASVAAGSPDFTLTVNGTGFVAGSSVRWDGADRPTTYLGLTQLTAVIQAGALSSGGPLTVSVFTPQPGGGTSNSISLSTYARIGHDTIADSEQGQPDFTAHAQNTFLEPPAGRLASPVGVAVDNHSGRLFVADSENRLHSWPNAAAQANGQPADLALGQPSLLEGIGNNGGLSARSLSDPLGLAVDAPGNLYVADANNNRVLEYTAPLSTGMAASHVFGQSGNFTTGLPNNGGLSANSLSQPSAAAVDPRGRLYLADAGNNRVLEFDDPLSNLTADHVFGQPDFTHILTNSAGPSATSLSSPAGVAVDAAGRLYVADSGNNRVLEYDHPLTDPTANRVFGQPDFTHNDADQDKSNASATSLFSPNAVAVDAAGHLYVADTGNNRVLEFDHPLSSPAADRVFGQPDFSEFAPNTGGISASSLFQPASLALDAPGNLYVADSFNNRVLEYDRPLPLLGLFLPLLVR